MPGFDGTGPFGKGPMTGLGRGFCILKASQEKPEPVEGFAGINGRPVGSTGQIADSEKEVIDMPGGDRTGPAGMGPMTGRAAGFCAGYPVPGYMNPAGARGFAPAAGVPAFGPYGAGSYGYGAGSYAYGAPYGAWGNPWLRRGFGFGFGRGFGHGRGRGRARGRFGYW